MASTAASTGLSLPRFSAIGLARAATLRMPSCTSAWASAVAVVVPSPAMSLVLVATSFTSCAPMFSKGSSNSTSRAIDTPSLVIVGAPNFFSSTTLRPRGPSVTRTELASLLTPASRARRASSSNFRSFAMGALLLRLDDGEDVATVQDEQVVAIDRDLGAAVLRVDDRVADLHVERDELTGLLRATAGTDGEDVALLRLLLRGVRDHQAAGRGLFRLARLHDDAVVEGLQVHCCPPLALLTRASAASTLDWRVLTLRLPVGARNRRVPVDADWCARR